MEEHGYINLLSTIIEHGEERDSRNGKTYSLFGEKLEFNIANGSYPLLTTKKMFWRGIVEELLWFLRGSTDANELKEKNVHIWDGNTTREFLDSRGLYHYEEGECGPIYGYQWRSFGGNYPRKEGGVDQVRFVLNELFTNPHGRRAVLSAWNPKQMDMMCLPPCHVLYNFYVGKNGLSCQMYQRSCDTCAGLPFNIASTALLTHIFAKVLHMEADKIVIVIGDTHVYEEHINGAKEQITRTPLQPPTIVIAKDPPPKDATVDEKLQWIESLTFEDFQLVGYESHGLIKYPMIA
jgi:thymidylate synthase